MVIQQQKETDNQLHKSWPIKSKANKTYDSFSVNCSKNFWIDLNFKQSTKNE